MATSLTQLRAGGGASEGNPFQQLLTQSGRFDPDAYHVMQERDAQLIEDELLRGVSSKAFVYSFAITGVSTPVTGVSVIGARQLASEYGGIKSRIVATVEKRGSLFIFRSFQPLDIETRVLHDLADDVDYYECIMQVDDIKTGNAIQVRKKELKTEQRSAAKGGGTYDRPHYDVICESKAYRNGVLSVLPQAVIQAFRVKHLAAGNTSTEKTMDQLRAGALAFAAKHGVSIDRGMLSKLTYAEVFGVGSAAASGVDAFVMAAQAIGLAERDSTGEVPPPAAPQPAAAPKVAAEPKPPAQRDWEPTEQELAEIEAREKAEAAGQQPAADPKPRGRRANPPAME